MWTFLVRLGPGVAFGGRLETGNGYKIGSNIQGQGDNDNGDRNEGSFGFLLFFSPFKQFYGVCESSETACPSLSR